MWSLSNEAFLFSVECEKRLALLAVSTALLAASFLIMLLSNLTILADKSPQFMSQLTLILFLTILLEIINNDHLQLQRAIFYNLWQT